VVRRGESASYTNFPRMHGRYSLGINMYGHADGDKEKLEVLWGKTPRCLNGSHPETEGYFTAPDQGYEWVN
jgi:hypothetical protein